MSITDKTADVLLFTPGRTPCTGPLAIVLHGYSSGIEMLDLEMERCPRPRPRQSTGCHTSFHYGVDGCNIHQYVALANTAWGFGVTPPTCPAPICPPDECASCTGLTVAQYNPDLDGNDPILPAFVAGTDGTANSCVIHVAVTGQSGFSALDAYGDCCRWMEKSYQCFVRSLCEIFEASGLTPSQTTLLVHCQELLCIDIDQLILDILACLDAPPAPPIPCQCTPTTAQFCASLSTVPVLLTPATSALGPDCAFHPIVAAPIVDVAVVGVDTATVDITVVEAPANTFTVSSDVIVSPDAGNQLVAQVNGLFVPASATYRDCTGLPLPNNSVLLQPPTVGSTDPSSGIILNSTDADQCTVFLTAPVCGSAVYNNPPRGVLAAANDGTVRWSHGWVNPSLVIAATVGFFDFNTAANQSNGKRVLISAHDEVNLINPATACDNHEVWVKNIGVTPLTIQANGGATLIDGQLAITLDGVIVAGYPFGNNGGESVHLVYDDVTAQWYVL